MTSNSKTPKLIAVFGGALHNEKEYSFLHTLECACKENGYFILAFSFSGENLHHGRGLESELTLIRLVENVPLSGIVMLRESLTSDMLVEAIKTSAGARNIPVFSLEKPTEGCINIVFDYKESFKIIVNHVIDEHDAKTIYMMGGLKGNEFSEERIDGYKEVLKEHGLDFDESMIYYGDFWGRPTRAAMEKMFASGRIPDAVCCANDSMAITVADVFSEKGYKVPEDVVVTGFDGIQSARFNNPPISTMTPDYEAEVDTIFKYIEEFEKTGFVAAREHKLLYALFPERSCGCKSANDRNFGSIISEISSDNSSVYWLIESMNHIISAASNLDSVSSIPYHVIREIGLWLQTFNHVGIFAELTDDDYTVPEGHTFATLYRNEDGEFTGMGDTYSEQVFMPGFEHIIERDDISRILMVRLLHTSLTPFGYMVEGFKELSNKELQRCAIIGMFLSTAIAITLSNKKLRLLNRRLIQANKEIADISVTDYLTGILNRRGFFDKLKDTVQDPLNEGKYLTLFSIDMDGLKSINDNFGHEEGDYAIKAMADAIRSFAARNGFSSRYGGDEFACALITDEPLNLSADDVRSRLHAVIRRQPGASEKKYCITASIGSSGTKIVPDEKEMNRSMEEMLRISDENMYKDKTAKDRHYVPTT